MRTERTSSPDRRYWRENFGRSAPVPTALRVRRFCGDIRPVALVNRAVAAIAAHLQAAKNNSLVAGYWVLDDAAFWQTPGYAIPILNSAHELIQQIIYLRKQCPQCLDGGLDNRDVSIKEPFEVREFCLYFLI